MRGGVRGKQRSFLAGRRPRMNATRIAGLEILCALPYWAQDVEAGGWAAGGERRPELSPSGKNTSP